MLIPARNALHFLTVYKEMLNRFAGGALTESNKYVEVREKLFASPERAHPPTKDPELLTALANSIYGDFSVARHLQQYSELLGPDGRAYRIKGISTEPSAMIDPWTKVRVVVLPFRGDWIWDGLLHNLHARIGPGTKREILDRVRDNVVEPPSGVPVVRERSVPPQPLFTPKQGEYLAFIHQYTKQKKRAPDEADMQRHFQVSAGTVQQVMLKLEKRGLIKRAPESRSIALLIPPEQLPA